MQISEYHIILSNGQSNNIVLPLVDGMRHVNNAKKVYSFNFPKEGVFVFNKPTIINLERNVKMSNMLIPEEKDSMPPSENPPNPFVLCKLFQVS